MDNEELELNEMTIEDVQNDAVMEHPNGTLWVVFGFEDLDYFNIYQHHPRKGFYEYNPFFLDDNPKIVIKKKGSEFKVGMTREDLLKELIHEKFTLRS